MYVVGLIATLKPDVSLLNETLMSMESSHLIDEVIVINQQTELEGSSLGVDKLPVVIVNVPFAGLSRARNYGLKCLPQAATHVVIADDDITYPTGSLRSALDQFEREVDVVCGRLEYTTAPGTSRMHFQPSPAFVDKRNVWQCSIEAATVMTVNFSRSLGGYDEELGLGADSPFQSGEGTDLLLRGLAAGFTARYTPDFVIQERPTSHVSSPLRARGYARGTGRIYRRHYSIVDCLWFVSRSFARLLLRSRTWRTASLEWHTFVGRVEGLTARHD